MTNYTKIIDFETILPIWKNQLWPNRESPIRPMTSMQYQGGYDMEVYELYKPTFFATYNDKNHITGVIGGQRTSNKLYLARGIWVDSMCRGQGIARLLFQEVFSQAVKEKCEAVWGLPRKNSLSAYEKAGFNQTSEFFNEGVEFGPNCYAYMKLVTNNK